MTPLLLLACCHAPAPFLKPDPAKVDLERMQGAWVLTRSHNRGVEAHVEGACVWTISGDRLSTSRDGKTASVCRITLDGKTRPGCIDLHDARWEGDPAPGRYGFVGEALIISIGTTRPPDLSGFGPSNGVWVFRRKRP